MTSAFSQNLLSASMFDIDVDVTQRPKTGITKDGMAHHDRHPVAFEVKVDDILQLAHTTSSRVNMLQNFPNGIHLQGFAHPGVQAVGPQGPISLATTVLYIPEMLRA